jgi:hypothetical protein
MKSLKAHSIEELKKILNDIQEGKINLLEEGEKPTLWNTAMEIDGTFEEYAHGIGDCSFAELQEKISEIQDKAYETHQHH